MGMMLGAAASIGGGEGEWPRKRLVFLFVMSSVILSFIGLNIKLPQAYAIACSIVVGNLAIAVTTCRWARQPLAAMVSGISLLVFGIAYTILTTSMNFIQDRSPHPTLRAVVPIAAKQIFYQLAPLIAGQILGERFHVPHVLIGSLLYLCVAEAEILGFMGFIRIGLAEELSFSAMLQLSVINIVFEVLGRNGFFGGIGRKLRLVQANANVTATSALKLASKADVGYLVAASFLGIWLRAWLLGSKHQAWASDIQKPLIVVAFYTGSQIVADLGTLFCQRILNPQPSESWFGTWKRTARPGGTLPWGMTPEAIPLPPPRLTDELAFGLGPWKITFTHINAILQVMFASPFVGMVVSSLTSGCGLNRPDNTNFVWKGDVCG